MTAPSWGIVATVDEPVQLLVAWAAWHIAQGAGALHLYLDRPDPTAELGLAGLPGVEVTLCDADHWRRLGMARPDKTMARQVANAADALARTKVDWLLHCDADEFLRDGAALGATLAGVPEGTDAVHLRMLERVRLAEAPNAGLFDGVFRRATPDFASFGETLYGRWAKFLENGLTGHGRGKSLVRRGGTARPGLHYAKTATGDFAAYVELRDALLHFDGLTPRAFLLKLAARIDLAHYNAPDNPDGPVRDHQVRFIRKNAGHGGRMAEFARGMLSLDPTQVEALVLLDHLVEAPFDPGPALAALGLAPDLSVAGFDAALMTRGGADLVARHGLALPSEETQA